MSMRESNWEGKIVFKFHTFDDPEIAERFVHSWAEYIKEHPNILEIESFIKKLTYTKVNLNDL